MLSGNKKLILLLIFFFSFTLVNVFLPIQIIFASKEAPKLKSKSAILIEAKRGQVLFERQSTERTHISSINKIMTALIVIEKENLDSKVTVSKESTNSEGSILNLQAGEKYSVEDLLYAIMLSSANDAANALAEYSGGDIPKFVAAMNSKCEKLNLKNTYFRNPTGLYDESQYTTAADISKLVMYAISNPEFNKIFSCQVKPLLSDTGTKMLINQNKLLWSYEGADGGRVGYNSQNLQTVVTSATKNNQRLISIVLDSPETIALEDSTLLLNYGFNNYKSGLLVSKEQPIKTITVENNIVDLFSLEDVYYTFPLGDNYLKSADFKLASNLVLPIRKDQIAGTIKYILKDDTEIGVNLYPAKDVFPPENKTTVYIKKLIENRDVFILLLILVLIELILIFVNFVKFIIKVVKLLSSHN